MKPFVKIIYCFKSLAFFAKCFILFIRYGYEYATDKSKQNPDVLSFISQRIRNAVSANLFLNSINLHIITFP